VEVRVDPAVAHVVTDPARLKQILYNYLSNAIKFSHDNGVVTVRVLPDLPGFFRLEVQDTGIGIAPSDLPRLFVEFQQLDASYTKRHQGTGLGLALTRRMVEAQGGSVGVRSELGQGSVFHIALPVAPDAACEPEAETSLPTPRTGDIAQWLVIEDNLHDQSRIASALTNSGHHVDVASSVEQALSRVDGKDYDALSLDLIGGSPGGLDVLAKMRDQAHGGASEVAALTLGARSGGTAAFSVADVLAKPPLASEIAHALKRFAPLTPGTRVMVIDDDPAALALMKSTLEACGVTPMLFQDGRQALHELARRAPAVIILDLLMPDFNGFDVLDALSKRADARDIPVFVWTQMSLTESEYDLLALSAAAILRKGGADVDSLIDKLRRWRSAAPLPERALE
jgi:CheY-like chemotaxis protein